MPRKVLRIVNQDNKREVVREPLDLLEILNSDDVILMLEEYVDRIVMRNSDGIRITAKKGWGSKEEINCDDVTITRGGKSQQSARPSRQNAQSGPVSQDVIGQIEDSDLAGAVVAYQAQQAAKKGDVAKAIALASTIKDADLRDATLAYIAMKQ
jgi:hypothetical protein